MFTQTKLHRSLLGFAGALAIGALSFSGVSAAGGQSTASVTQQINGGGLTASIGSGSLNTIFYSDAAQVTSGTVHLDVSDATGSSLGWNVTVSSSAFLYGGTSSIGLDIPSTNFSIASAGAPSYVSGQPINSGAGNGPLADVGGALNAARRTILANPGFGSGSYGQDLGLSLNVPAFSQAGTYTATLTVTVATAP